MWIGVISLFLVLLISLFLTRMATMALMFTGLSRESARFQARSALSGVGFTTSEAEQVVQHPVRRRVIMLLMLLGNAGIVGGLAAVLLTFLMGGDQTPHWIKLLVIFVGLVLFVYIANSKWVERWMSSLIAWALKRYTDVDVRDYVHLLELSGGYAVTEMHIDEENWMEGRTLAELRLTDEGVLVLGVRTRRGRYIGVPRGDSVINAGDVLVLYGDSDRLAEIGMREKGDEGDEAHERATTGFQMTMQ